MHVFTGLLQTEMTYDFLKKLSALPFILTRSITMGSNMYGFHWGGENEVSWPVSWQVLRSSIPDNFNSQLFGMQMQGADICGSIGDTQA